MTQAGVFPEWGYARLLLFAHIPPRFDPFSAKGEENGQIQGKMVDRVCADLQIDMNIYKSACIFIRIVLIYMHEIRIFNRLEE